MITVEQESILYETDRVYVRGLCLADIDGSYFHWLNDQEVCQFNSHGLFPNTRARLEAFVGALDRATDRVVWAVIEKEQKTHIGNVSLQCIDWINRSAEFAVLMGEKAYWGKGYAEEAASLLFRHGFQKLNLHRIYCGTASENVGMQKLALKLKMRHEGTRRVALFLNGKYQDLLEYGVLKDEFLS